MNKNKSIVVRARRDKRIWFVMLGVFVAVFLFSFLAARFKGSDEFVEAASLANFDPGYIISDYQMGNYNSMSEAEIQAFLTAKNPCNNRDYNLYLNMEAWYPNIDWHWKDGHFVCISEEKFGNGTVVGEGETAAHIIWQAAQDYRINPQVLIVLLQKEQGLITDDFPHSGQYKTATGYGCPDTAPCYSEYFGFKNQVRKAAALFRTVLDGGWTNYPLGNNYIQYNPNSGCGGTVVNIRSLATSALYRYTPYQPNAGALAAGYGTAACGAYGNRNFYLYFEDWFGGVTAVGVEWQTMQNPRKMIIKVKTNKINPVSLEGFAADELNIGQEIYFASKIDVVWNGKRDICLRTAYDTKEQNNKCVLMSRMGEYIDLDFAVEKITPITLTILEDTFKYDLMHNILIQEIKKERYKEISFSAKVIVDEVEYYQTSYDVANNNKFFIPAKSLSSQIVFEKFVYPRNLVAAKNEDFVELGTNKVCRSIDDGHIDYYVAKTYFGGDVYYRTKTDTEAGVNCVIRANSVKELPIVVFSDFVRPRSLRFIRNAKAINLSDKVSCGESFYSGDVVKFTTKIDLAGKTYFRTEESSNSDSFCVFLGRDLEEI